MWNGHRYPRNTYTCDTCRYAAPPNGTCITRLGGPTIPWVLRRAIDLHLNGWHIHCPNQLPVPNSGYIEVMSRDMEYNIVSTISVPKGPSIYVGSIIISRRNE